MVKEIVAAEPGGQGIDWNEFTGKLFVVEPLEVEKDVNTVHGVTDAVRANVYVLLGKNKSEEFEDTLIFPRVLQSQTRRKIGRIVVGRLEQGEAKRGQNPPWVFAAGSASDIKKASDFLSARSISGAEDADEDDYADDDGEAF